MTCTKRRLDGEDNRSLNTVMSDPMCVTVSKGARGEVDEPSDTPGTDSAELSDTDGRLDSDVWDDMDRPVWRYGSCTVDNLSQASQTFSNYGDVACMG